MVERSFELTLNRAEVLRALAGLGDAFEPGPEGRWVWAARDGTRSCTLRLVPLPPLALGPVPLERHRLEWSLEGYSPEEVEALVQRFLRHIQRAGG